MHELIACPMDGSDFFIIVSSPTTTTMLLLVIGSSAWTSLVPLVVSELIVRNDVHIWVPFLQVCDRTLARSNFQRI